MSAHAAGIDPDLPWARLKQSQPYEVEWRNHVLVLVISTALVSPALIVATGWLWGGWLGVGVAVVIALPVGVGLVSNDMAVIREVMAGGTVWLTVMLRSLVPIGVSTLAEIPILLALCAGDIDWLHAEHAHAITVPVLVRVSHEVDGEIAQLRRAVEAAIAERDGLRREVGALVTLDQVDADRLRKQLGEAEEAVRRDNLELACEADGSICLSASTGRAGEGPVFNAARHRRDDALAKTEALRREIATLADRRRDTRTPLAHRLSVLEDGSAVEGSVGAADQRLAAALAIRGDLIARRVAEDPDVVAVRRPLGPAQRLVALADFLFANPVLFVLGIAAKVVQTAFELSGVIRGIRFARLSWEARCRMEARTADRHSAAMEQIERDAELARAASAARHAVWRARRASADERLLDLFNGVRALVLKHLFGRS